MQQLCNKNTCVSRIKMDVKHYNLILYLIVGSGSFEMETLQGGNQICIKRSRVMDGDMKQRHSRYISSCNIVDKIYCTICVGER